MGKVEIPIRKGKLLFGVAGSVLFAAVGVWFFTTLAENQGRYHPLIVKVVGVFFVIFFSLAALFSAIKLFNKKPGLVMDDEGIIDNTNAPGVGLIQWNDITAITTEQVMATKFLLICTNKPDEIIEKAGPVKQKLMKGNMNMYGTPLSIASGTLRYDFDDLEKLLKSKLSEHQKKRSSM